MITQKEYPTSLNGFSKNIVAVLIFLMLQSNIFQVLNRLVISKSPVFQFIYAPFKFLKNAPIATPFIKQDWGLYSPNPPEQIGFLRIEGENETGDIVNLSTLDPLERENFFKTEDKIPIRLFDMRARFCFDQMRTDTLYRNNKTMNDIKNIWTTYHRNRLKNRINQYKKIEVFLYSCKSRDFLKTGIIEFHKEKLFDL